MTIKPASADNVRLFGPDADELDVFRVTSVRADVLERRPEATTRGGWTKPAVKPRHAVKKNIFPTRWLSQRLLSRTPATQGVLGGHSSVLLR